MSTTDQDAPPVRYDVSLIGEGDLHLFNEGTHTGLFAKLGAHPIRVDGVEGTHFAVWAPNAEAVSVIGDVNGWDPRAHPLGARGRVRHLGGVHPRVRARRELQVPHRRRGRRVPGGQVRPLRRVVRGSAEDRLGRVEPRLRVGRRGVDADASRRRLAREPDEHLRGAPRLVDARPGRPDAVHVLPRARPRAWPSTAHGSGSPTSSCCRSPSTRSTARGATRRPATSRRRAGTAPRRTSCGSSTTCTRTASA